MTNRSDTPPGAMEMSEARLAERIGDGESPLYLTYWYAMVKANG